jgi:hypothetical protein
VEGVAKVGETLTAKVTPEKATVTYKWMRADAEDGEYVAIAGATDKTYTLSEADAGKWIKVEVKGTGNYTGTKIKVVGPVEEVEEPVEPEPEKATLEATGVYGINDNKVYAGYELQDKDDTQIPLIESKIESISVKDPDGNVTELTVVGETDPYLWFNITKKAGTYTYTVVTKGEDAKTYEATIDWNEPTEATVSFQAPAGAEAVFTAASEDAPAQVDFSQVTADKLLDWTSVKDGYYAIELKIEGVDLSEDNVKYAFRMYEDGTAIAPEIKGDLDCQYVTTDWELGTATMYYVLADGSLYQATINVASLTPAEKPVVKGSIARDPGNTGGDLGYSIEDNTVTFTSGEIKWYPEDEDLGRAAGNRVGVQINAPADFNTEDVTVTIGENEYNWDVIEDGDGYFWWYPLVTADKDEYTATVVWNESSTQVFKVVIGENVTLEPALDTTAPEFKSVSPAAGNVNLEYGETFKLEVTASDDNLYELEVDHSFEGTLPEFSVYASEENPYGDDEAKAAFKAQGVTVTYDADEQKWTIDFGENVTSQIVDNGGITFYLVLVDEAGNKWGSMDPTTPENTFKYNVTQDEVPDEAQFVWDVNRIEGEGNMSEKLLELGNAAYGALEAVQKVEVAKLFIINRPEEGFANIEAIETALGEAISQYNGLLGAVNSAETVEAMKTALQAIGTRFNIGVTDLMAQAALDGKGDGYGSISEIIAVIHNSIANVGSLAEFKAALEDASKTVINLTADFSTDEKILVDRAVTINGGDKKITFTNDPTGWQGNYVLHVYNTTGVTIKDIKLTGGDAALLVNGSEVTLTGAIDVSGNEFGGIESSKGVGLENDPELTVTDATFTNGTEAYGLPTIWEDGVTGTVEGFVGFEIVKGTQPQYYLKEANSLDPNAHIANVGTLEDFKAALEDASKTVINLTADFSTDEKILVDRAVTINGGDKKITFTNDPTGWQGNYVLHVYNTTGVTIKDIKLTGGDAALLVNGSEVTLEGAIDVSGNEFGGIESSKGVGVGTNPKLTVTDATFTNGTEAYGLPTIWEDKITGTVETSDGQFTVNAVLG